MHSLKYSINFGSGSDCTWNWQRRRRRRRRVDLCNVDVDAVAKSHWPMLDGRAGRERRRGTVIGWSAGSAWLWSGLTRVFRCSPCGSAFCQAGSDISKYFVAIAAVVVAATVVAVAVAAPVLLFCAGSALSCVSCRHSIMSKPD